MLTKKDLELIDALMQKRIEQDVPKVVNVALEEFYDHFFEPHVTRSEEHHQEIVREIKKLQGREDMQDDYIKEHDTRLTELEKVAKVKN